MSSAQHAARIIKRLELNDWKVLKALESSMKKGEFTPITHLTNESRLDSEEVEFRLKRLQDFELVRHDQKGFAMVWAGYDALALRGFVDRNLISGMGMPIGVGKESDVLEAFGDKGDKFAIKFYRIGRISFRDTRRKRMYLPSSQHQWLLVNSAAAKREFESLQKLYPLGISVPHTIARERHVILMNKVEGKILANLIKIPRESSVLRKILFNVSKAYRKGGLINSDLSEFNILYDGVNIWLIDWPQAVEVTHKNAENLIKRDVYNIVNFFKRRHNIRCDAEGALAYVKGNSKKLVIV
ncbi:MAG: serine/threonine protein phosphatase [Thaumarchaeota archaeon]|nr:serine/threonine protein phosphatase [Nitrososphaerota archaeon]